MSVHDEVRRKCGSAMTAECFACMSAAAKERIRLVHLRPKGRKARRGSRRRAGARYSCKGSFKDEGNIYDECQRRNSPSLSISSCSGLTVSRSVTLAVSSCTFPSLRVSLPCPPSIPPLRLASLSAPLPCPPSVPPLRPVSLRLALSALSLSPAPRSCGRDVVGSEVELDVREEGVRVAGELALHQRKVRDHRAKKTVHRTQHLARLHLRVAKPNRDDRFEKRRARGERGLATSAAEVAGRGERRMVGSAGAPFVSAAVGSRKEAGREGPVRNAPSNIGLGHRKKRAMLQPTRSQHAASESRTLDSNEGRQPGRKPAPTRRERARRARGLRNQPPCVCAPARLSARGRQKSSAASSPPCAPPCYATAAARPC
eukprot:5924116-Pleurochrysis_carterae.AAC.1